MMKLIINSKIRIINPTPAISKWCKENLVLDNPDYYKRLNMGKWTGNTPQNIWLYEKSGNDLILPFGCIRDIWRMCVRGIQWKAEFHDLRRFNYQSHINLYSYQEKAVNEAINAKNGILVMPCGSGKTQSGLEIISRIGGRALWLTHTQDLLNQSKKRAESVMDNVGCGVITAGKVNIGSGITFATIQTMCKIDLQAHKNDWDIIIIDECQHCCGSPTRITQFYKVISNLCARYKIGLTATPKRADGLERSMFALLGGIIHEVSREKVADTTCPIRVEQIQTGWVPDYDCILMGDGTIDYHKVVENMTQDEERFKFVSNYINGCIGGCLVLANRVEYLQRLQKAYIAKSVCLSGMGQSKAAKEERKQALDDLNNGKIDCVFASYKLAAEGLDCPNLKYVVLATPEKDSSLIQQATGRVGRKAPGKEYGTVIDFVDDFGMYRGWSKKRQGYYRKICAESL